MKTYRGYRAGGCCAVEVSRARWSRSRLCSGDTEIITWYLPSQLGLHYHFPGFDWGPSGQKPGMLQFALAILVDALGEEMALECYEDFQASVAATLGDTWTMTDDDIFDWYRRWKAPCQETSLEELVGETALCQS
jgi:hypothetical protein